MERKRAWLAGGGNYIEIVFSDYGEDDMFQSGYRYGEVLLTFTRKGDDIITNWGKIRPMLEENSAPGVYFEKEEGAYNEEKF